MLAARRNLSIGGAALTAASKIVDSLESTMNSFLIRGLIGAAVGERRETAAAAVLIASAARVEVVFPASNNRTDSTKNSQDFSWEMPAITTGAGSVVINVPLTAVAAAAADLDHCQNCSTAIVDVAVQIVDVASGQLPLDLGIMGFVIGAASVYISVSELQSNRIILVQEAPLSRLLLNPVLITIPVSPNILAASTTTLCVAWNGTVFSTEGCTIHSITANNDAVTCACKRLALIAVVGTTNNRDVMVTTAANNGISSPTGIPSRWDKAVLSAAAENSLPSTQAFSSPSSDGILIPPPADDSLVMAPLAAYASASVGVLSLVVIVTLVHRLRVAWRLIHSLSNTKKPVLKRTRRPCTVKLTAGNKNQVSASFEGTVGSGQSISTDSVNVQRWAASPEIFLLETDLVLMDSSGQAVPTHSTGPERLNISFGKYRQIHSSSVQDAETAFTPFTGEVNGDPLDCSVLGMYASADASHLTSWNAGMLHGNPVVLSQQPSLSQHLGCGAPADQNLMVLSTQPRLMQAAEFGDTAGIPNNLLEPVERLADPSLGPDHFSSVLETSEQSSNKILSSTQDVLQATTTSKESVMEDKRFDYFSTPSDESEKQTLNLVFTTSPFLPQAEMHWSQGPTPVLADLVEPLSTTIYSSPSDYQPVVFSLKPSLLETAADSTATVAADQDGRNSCC